MRLPRMRFTVRRMMVVVAIITPLLLMVRAVDRAREAARRSQCTGDISFVAHLIRIYNSANGSFPPGTVPNPALPPERRLSWVVELWPYFNGGAVLSVDRSKGWDEPPNRPLKVMAKPGSTFVGMTPEDSVSFLTCYGDPAREGKARPRPLSYVGVAGLGADAATLPSGHRRAGVFGYDRVTRLADITDGRSQTMMLIETARGNGPWMAGGPSSIRGVDPATRPYIGRNRPFGGYHPGGANVAFADGSVRFLRESIDPKVFEALSTIAGGETLPSGSDR